MILLAIVVIAGAIAFFVKSAGQKNIHLRAQEIIAKHSHKAVAQAALISLRKQSSEPKLDKIFEGLPSLRNIRAKIEKLDGNYSFGSFLKRFVIYSLAQVALLKMGFGMGLSVALLLGVLLGFFMVNFGLNRRVSKRQRRFLQLMPDALDLMVRGLRSGLPVTESMQSIADEIEDPVRSVFVDITTSVKMGVAFEAALYDAAKKLELNEFNFLAISISLQRETGGNLAEILQNLSETIRARMMMKLKIRAISSEARASSYIVGALPFVVVTVLLFASPDYLDPLFNNFSGNIALAVAVFMFSFGMFVMNKMSQMEV